MPGATHSEPVAILVDGEPAASLNALDRGLHYGDGLFETMALVDGDVLWAEDHLRRLGQGMDRLGIAGLDMPALREEMARLAEGVARGVLKLIVTRGAGGRGYGPPGDVSPTRVLMRYPWPAPPAGAAEDGVRLRCCETPLGRNPRLAGIKHLNRLEQVLARREWEERGIDADIVEGLMFDEKGLLIEGVSSNVFLCRGDTILTPRLDHCGVRGIVRQKLSEIATILSMQLIEKDIDRGGLEALLDEGAGLFLTNSLIGLWPARELDGRPIPIPDAVRRLQAALARQRGAS